MRTANNKSIDCGSKRIQEDSGNLAAASNALYIFKAADLQLSRPFFKQLPAHHLPQIGKFLDKTHMSPAWSLHLQYLKDSVAAVKMTFKLGNM